MTVAKHRLLPDPALPARIAAVRRFNRFYTRRIGVLQEGLLKSPFSLTEARVLYELAHREDATASALVRDLGLDAGYLSRLLRGFEERGLIKRAASPLDARQSLLTLTALGRAAFAPLDHRSQDEIGAMLRALPAPAQKRLVEDMADDRDPAGRAPRPFRPLYPAAASARRSRVDRPSPWRALCRGIWLGRQLRGAGGGDRRQIPARLRRPARALLDRRARGGDPGLGDGGAPERRGRQAAPAAGRARRPAASASAGGSSRNA